MLLLFLFSSFLFFTKVRYSCKAQLLTRNIDVYNSTWIIKFLSDAAPVMFYVINICGVKL